jgi:hypothetical protein
MPETITSPDGLVVVHIHNDEADPFKKVQKALARLEANTAVSHRRFTTDGRPATSRGVKIYGGLAGIGAQPTRKVPRDQGPVKRTLVATYPGTSFTAERNEDGSLSVYHVGDENMSTSLTGDAGRMTAKRYQDLIVASRR